MPVSARKSSTTSTPVSTTKREPSTEEPNFDADLDALRRRLADATRAMDSQVSSILFRSRSNEHRSGADATPPTPSPVFRRPPELCVAADEFVDGASAFTTCFRKCLRSSDTKEQYAIRKFRDGTHNTCA